jgi:hypothetical protein
MPSKEPETFNKPQKTNWGGCLTRIIIAILIGIVIGSIKQCNRDQAMRNAMGNYNYNR